MKDIKDYSDSELKVLAYDNLRKMEFLRRDIKVIELELDTRDRRRNLASKNGHVKGDLGGKK